MSNDAIPLDIDHAKHSVGGMSGHIFRRFTHVIMCLVPILYYTKGDQLSDFFSMEPNQFVTYCLLILILLEILRLYFGIIIVGQREYEAKQISALAWVKQMANCAQLFEACETLVRIDRMAI